MEETDFMSVGWADWYHLRNATLFSFIDRPRERAIFHLSYLFVFMSPDIFSSEFKSFLYRSKDQMIYSVLQTTRDSNNKPRYYYYYY
jgi:hypothetical protein